ncbi:MAG: hypothetical protein IJ418_09915 [Clostridia bacterium]|nr:hypothetical protein [Clostridia bacterium]
MFVDIHQHLVFDMDDGARSFEESKNMICLAYEQGVSHIIATPHCIPGVQEFHMERFKKNLQLINDWCREQKKPVSVHMGAEVYYTPHTVQWLTDGRVPTLASSNYILIEFSSNASYDEIVRASRKMTNAGYLPVLAHVERYRYLRNKKHLARLKEDYPVLIQMNADTFLRRNTIFEENWLRQVLEMELVDIVASDAHNTTNRLCQMSKCHSYFMKKYGQRVADQLHYGTGKHIILSCTSEDIITHV